MRGQSTSPVPCSLSQLFNLSYTYFMTMTEFPSQSPRPRPNHLEDRLLKPRCPHSSNSRRVCRRYSAEHCNELLSQQPRLHLFTLCSSDARHGLGPTFSQRLYGSYRKHQHYPPFLHCTSSFYFVGLPLGSCYYSYGKL